MQKTGKNKIVSGMLWTFGERIAAQLVSTIVTIVLARILDPVHYGAISIVTVFISFLNVFVSGGFDSALIQKKDADDLDFDTAFVISISVSAVLYLVLFFAAPAIARFYNMPVLSPVFRVMGLRLILASFNSIQQANIRRAMNFKSFFWATLLGTVISGFAGVLLALKGAGVWALAVQYLTNVTIDTLMLFIIGTWVPHLRFSAQRAKAIWSFGWKVLATTLVYTLEGDLRSLIVGKTFGAADLAYYDQGKKFPALFVNNISSSINKVMLPAYSKISDDRDQLLMTLRRSIRIGVFLLTPLLLGFAAVAESFVAIILTHKWDACIPFIQILSMTYLTRPLEDTCHQALLSIGKSNVVLKCMIVINAFALVFVLIAAFILHSVIAIAWFGFLCTVISLTVFLFSAKKYLFYTLRMQLHDIVPSLTAGIVMGVIVLLIGKTGFNDLITIILQIITGAAVYTAMAAVLKIDTFYELCSFIKKKRS